MRTSGTAGPPGAAEPLARVRRVRELLPLVGLEGVVPSGGAVVLAPHPDDEVLGTGATIARPASATAATTGRSAGGMA